MVFPSRRKVVLLICLVSGFSWYVGDSPHLWVFYLSKLGFYSGELGTLTGKVGENGQSSDKGSKTLHGSDRRLLAGVTLQK